MSEILQRYTISQTNSEYETETDREAQAELIRTRDIILGPRETRNAKTGRIVLERYSDGRNLNPVAPGTRCYPLGLTYEKPTTISAPNANSKVSEGIIDPNTEHRANFMKV